ncbi:Hypothetical protein UVM_LOCUS301 [uncultured virus]|nr:Hypothetical protein UVM_LOCUS301 [uncultured virus]
MEDDECGGQQEAFASPAALFLAHLANCHGPVVKRFVRYLSLFEAIALAKTHRVLAAAVLQGPNFGLCLARKLRARVLSREANSLFHPQTGEVHSQANLEWLMSDHPSNTKRSRAAAARLLAAVLPFREWTQPFAEPRASACIANWTDDMRQMARFVCIRACEQPIWMHRLLVDPRMRSVPERQKKCARVGSHHARQFGHLVTRPVQPRTWRKPPVAKPLTVDEKKVLLHHTTTTHLLTVVQINSYLQELGLLFDQVLEARPYEHRLQAIFDLLHGTLAMQTGKDVHPKIRIRPPSDGEEKYARFASGAVLLVPSITLRATRFSYGFHEYPAVVVTTKTYHAENARFTGGLACIILSDGSVLSTINLWVGATAYGWNEQLGRLTTVVGEPAAGSVGGLPDFLREFDADLWHGCGVLGKLCNACILCGRPLSVDNSLEQGFGDVCKKQWGLQRWQHDNSVVLGSSSTVKNAASRQDVLSIAADADEVVDAEDAARGWLLPRAEQVRCIQRRLALDARSTRDALAPKKKQKQKHRRDDSEGDHAKRARVSEAPVSGLATSSSRPSVMPPQ